MPFGKELVNELKQEGFDFFTGVPCSFLTPVLNTILSDDSLAYVGAANEGDAIAIASGAVLAGKRAVTMFQNSGLGNAVNPLTSLSHPFKIPLLVLTTWRGEPGRVDEPQHKLMGSITKGLIDLMGFEQHDLPMRQEDVKATVHTASKSVDTTSLPTFLVMRESADRQSFEPPKTATFSSNCTYEEFPQHTRVKRYTYLERIVDIIPRDAGLLATTGKCGRELNTIQDSPQFFYQVGSMGCVASLGLGISMNTARPVVVLDGDGSLLMRMGSLGTIGFYCPTNYVHIVFDNGTHDSTGGQPTVSNRVNFSEIARSCGYKYVATCSSVDDFEAAFSKALCVGGPAFIRVYIDTGSLKNLGRPSMEPHTVAARFSEFLQYGQAVT